MVLDSADVVSILDNPVAPLLVTLDHSVNGADLPPTVTAPDTELLIGFKISKYGLVLSYPLTTNFPLDLCTITPEILTDFTGLLTFRIKL